MCGWRRFPERDGSVQNVETGGRRGIGDPSPWARLDFPEPLKCLSESSAVQWDLPHGKSQSATVRPINHKSLFCSVLHKLSFVFSPDVQA